MKKLAASLCVLAAAASLGAWMAPDGTPSAPELKSIGALAFGPGNTLFIGDSEAGSILAVQLDDAAQPAGAFDLAGVDRKIAQVLGTTPEDIIINDLAVHPVSHNVYLSVTRGRGAGATPVLLRVTRNANRPIEAVSLENVRFTVAPISNAPASNPTARRNPRTQTVTDLAFMDGQLYVAGLSNEEFSSAFRRIPYPFSAKAETTTLEIYHVSHGQNETHAPVMTFLPQRINGKQFILAAYTCTPLVAFEAESLKNGQHVFGRTVAELGAGNQPIDMVAVERDGKTRILIANSRHPMMLVDATDIAGAAALKSPTKEPGVARVPLSQPGVRQLADFDRDHVIVLQTGTDGLQLRTLAKASL